MKRILLALLLLITVKGFSQSSWVEPGTKWSYSSTQLMGDELMQFEYTHDTIIDAHNCQVLQGHWYYYYPAHPPQQMESHIVSDYILKYIIYSSNDTVFYLTNAGFMPLYIFSAEVGDSWIIAPGQSSSLECPYLTVKVIAKDTVSINGQDLRRLTIVPGDSSSIGFGNGFGYSYITEKIGTTGGGYFLPYGGPYCLPDTMIYEYTFYRFNCFSNNQFSYNETLDCDGPLAVTEITPVTSNFSIFPNPSQGITNINPSNSAYSYNISVYDIAGRQMQTLSGLKGNYQLDTEALPKGVYAIRIGQGSRQYYHKLIIN